MSLYLRKASRNKLWRHVKFESILEVISFINFLLDLKQKRGKNDHLKVSQLLKLSLITYPLTLLQGIINWKICGR